jgi:leucyl aminopeptidase (aminopeptidase T)
VKLVTMDDRCRQAASRILKECLGLRESQDLLLIADDAGLEPARVIQKVAWENRIPSVIAYVPAEQQREISSNDDLHKPLAAAIEEVDAILNCLGDDADCTSFRGAVVAKRQIGLKIAHMPGVTTQMLRVAGDVDYQALATECEKYLYPLLRGLEIEIQTGRGRHSLTAKLVDKNTRRIPVPSSGLIKDGSWGNIPAGETYISPVTGSADGEILIDGSLLKRTTKRGKPVLLTFKEGNLDHYNTDDEEMIARFSDLERLAVSRDDEGCWRNLAEIGIGTNPKIRRFSGIAVLDEKKGETAHIAIGRSKGFGGEVHCSIHEDMVFRKPTILVDGRAIVDRGARAFEVEDWLETLNDVEVPGVWASKAGSFSRSARGRADLAAKAKIGRVYETGPGQSICVQIGDNRTSALARRVYELVPEYQAERVSLADITKKLEIAESVALKALYLLNMYELVFEH